MIAKCIDLAIFAPRKTARYCSCKGPLLFRRVSNVNEPPRDQPTSPHTHTKLAELEELRFAVKLGLSPRMGQQSSQIRKQMPVSMCDPSRRQNQDPLLVLLDAVGRRLALGARRPLREGFVRGGHILDHE